MCGITGLVRVDGAPVNELSLRRMTDALSHRGPDGEGYWVNGSVGLGHRRLAILDLSSTADQPMVSADGRYALTYNGEVYNFREVRANLERLGHVFRSSGDTEVVLRALIEWGSDALGRLNGMFALALWDNIEMTLLLARDRYGIKPLYFADQGRVLAFASEKKAIVASGLFSKTLDLAALVEYFTFQNLLTSRTFLEEVRLFPAGHFATLNLGSPDPSLNFVRYWDFAFEEPETPMAHEEYLEELVRLFETAVGRQLVADVEVGSYLSGGMDSGSIVAVASPRYPGLKTFTCGFDLNKVSGWERGFDERKNARALSRRFDTQHHEVVMEARDLEKVIPSLSRHVEEPRVGQSCPNFLVSQLASGHVKVVLSGAGGDELFGGYPWRYIRAVTDVPGGDGIDRYFRYWHRLCTEKELHDLFAPIRREVAELSTREIFKSVFEGGPTEGDSTAEGRINSALRFEAKTFLHGLLVVEDKISMAHGLECRLPFLDNDLVDFAMRCPVNLKLGNVSDGLGSVTTPRGDDSPPQFTRSNDGKKILREAMNQYLPPGLTDAVKQGFSAPDSSWFRGDSRSYISSVLLSQETILRSYMDPDILEMLVTQHFEGTNDRRLLVWSLLNAESWMQSELSDSTLSH